MARQGLEGGAWRGPVAFRARQVVARIAAAERDRWALWLPVAFATGIAVYFALPVEPPAGIAFGLALVFAASAAWGWLRARTGRAGQGLAMAGLVLAAAASGLALARLHADLATAPVLERRLGPVAVEGRVVALEPGLKGARLTLQTMQIARLAPERTPRFVRLRLRGDGAGIAVGDAVSLTAILMPPPGPSMPGAYDFARDAWFRGLGAVGFAFGAPERLAAAPAERSLVQRAGDLLSETRRTLHRRITDAVPGTAGAVASALMTGERGEIPPEVMEDMRDSGLAHLLAISGLHVGLVTGVLFFAFRGLLALFPAVALRHPIKKWAAVFALCGGGIYMLLTGATVPTQRAFLMAALVFTAVLVDRAAISMRLVAWAAFVVLLVAPESLTGPSFQMSFAAVIALVATYEAARGPFARLQAGAGWGRRILLYFAGVALTTLVAGLATAPFAVYHFNRMATFGLIANMGAVPITALWIMPWAVLSYFLAPFGLEALALAPMGWGLEGMLWIAQRVAAWPGASVSVPEMPVASLALIVAGGLWLSLWRTKLRLGGVALAAAGLGLALAARPPDIIVSGDARSFAVRTPQGGLVLVGEPLGAFERDTWLRRAGVDSGEAPLSADAPSVPGGRSWLSCDALACVYRVSGQSVSLVRDPAAASEDCSRVDAVVGLVPLTRQRCPRKLVDFFDLWRDGGHALWLGPTIRVQSVAEVRGRRPWVRERPSRDRR